MSLLVTNTEDLPSAEGKCQSGLQIALTITPKPGENISNLCHRLARQLHEQDATPLHMLGFGNIHASTAVTDALRNNFGRADWPVTWVEGAACDGRPIAGIQVHAFTGDVERITLGGRIVGSVFTDAVPGNASSAG